MIRVVVADDHHVVRRGLTGLIDSADDLEVVGVATNGAEAVELVRELRPDVALMDLQMPEVDGVEATRTILAEELGTEVLVLTSFSDQARIRALLELAREAYHDVIARNEDYVEWTRDHPNLGGSHLAAA